MTEAITQINDNKKKIFWTLAAILVFFLSVYVFFMTQTILNTVAYKNIEQKITVIDSNASELEFKYIKLKNSINFSLAEKLGYAEASNVKFIDKHAINKTLSLSP